MAPLLPRVVQRPSPNYSALPIRHDLVVVHRCEGGYAGSVAWLCDRRAQASAHLVMRADGSEATQLVPLGFKAWAQCAFNGAGVSLEIEGFTADGFPEAVARPAANVVGWLCAAYAIPPVWAEGGRGRGVCQHVDLGAAGGGHHDACGVGSDAWRAFLRYVSEAHEAFTAGPLPPFALHGLPNPHMVELPPQGAVEASHGGAPRLGAPEATPPHPTSSGYPEGSVADLQARLNRSGTAPALSIDGVAGPATRAALQKFQASHGLPADGAPGGRTWAALRAACPA